MSLCLGSQFDPAEQFWSPGQGTTSASGIWTVNLCRGRLNKHARRTHLRRMEQSPRLN
jgi:hypothetical protein